MKDFRKIEQNCLDHLSVDFLPLNDIIREFSGFEIEPMEVEFLNAMIFLRYLIDTHKLNTLEGPHMNLVKKSSKELIEWLKQKWYSGNYNEIDYGIWFEKP